LQRKPNEESYNEYRFGGYYFLQNWLASKILQVKKSNANAYISMGLVPAKSSEYVNDEFNEIIE
jgi:hypothetical protein